MEDIVCEVFGDESTSRDNKHAIYSLVGFKPSEIELASLALSQAKEEFNVPTSARLHCRELFAGHQRGKTEWRALDSRKPVDFCRSLSSRLLTLNLYWSYGYVDLMELQGLPKPERMEGKFSTVNGREFSFTFGPKQAQKFAYAAAEIPFIQKFGSERLRFWCDKETTKIDWFFGKKQAHNINQGLGPKPLTELPNAYAPMLEIADLFAYTANRHLSGSQQFGQHIFRTIHEKFHPIATKFNFDPSLFGSSISTKDWLTVKSM
jgi:hypothetical protein